MLGKDPLSLSLACVKVRTIASADSCKLSRRLFCLRNFFKHSLQIRLLSSIGTAIGSFLNSSSIGNSERPRTFMRDVLSLSFAAHKTQQTSYIFNRVPGVLAAIFRVGLENAANFLPLFLERIFALVSKMRRIFSLCF